MNFIKKEVYYLDEDLEVNDRGIIIIGNISLDEIVNRVGRKKLKKAGISIDLKNKHIIAEGDVQFGNAP